MSFLNLNPFKRKRAAQRSFVVLSRSAELALVFSENVLPQAGYINIVVANNGERVEKTCKRYKGTGSICVYCVDYRDTHAFNIDVTQKIYRIFDIVLVCASFCSPVFFNALIEEFRRTGVSEELLNVVTWRNRIPTEEEKRDTFNEINSLFKIGTH